MKKGERRKDAKTGEEKRSERKKERKKTQYHTTVALFKLILNYVYFLPLWFLFCTHPHCRISIVFLKEIGFENRPLR